MSTPCLGCRESAAVQASAQAIVERSGAEKASASASVAVMGAGLESQGGEAVASDPGQGEWPRASAPFGPAPLHLMSVNKASAKVCLAQGSEVPVLAPGTFSLTSHRFPTSGLKTRRGRQMTCKAKRSGRA